MECSLRELYKASHTIEMMISAKFSSCVDTTLPALSNLSSPWNVVAAFMHLVDDKGHKLVKVTGSSPLFSRS